MGNKAEDQETITPEEKVDDVEVVEPEESTEEESEDITPTPETEVEEVEIVLEGGGSQPQKTDIVNKPSNIRKRINKLTSKVSSANEATSEANAKLAVKDEQIAILTLAVEQKQAKQVVTAPNPDDFDEGTSDPEFVKKQGEYTQSIIQQEVARQVSDASKQTQNTVNLDAQSKEFERKGFEHYERVKDLKVENYFEREDKAIEILGKEAVNYLIQKFPDAHNILYFYGTDANLQKAEELADLIQTDAGLAMAEIGALRVKLVVKPKTKTPSDPDEEIPGSSPVPNAQLLKKLDKLREEAAETRNMDALMDFKKAHPELV